jgi:parallel beta-helix repeat protein
MENTAGIYIDSYRGSSTASETVRVRYNKAKNIDGRYRNSGRGMVQFCVLNNVRSVKNIEIAWNEVINKPNESAVEDNINMHLSSGTSDSPILIHDNYIQGAYPSNLTSGFSGGGIMLADGANATASDASAFVRAYGNHVVSTTNYGIAIAGGHDNLIYNNRVISCGYVNLSSGLTYISGQNVGIYIMNVTKSTAFYNNTARDNISGWVKKSLSTKK